MSDKKKLIFDFWASGVSYCSQYQAVLDYATAQGYTKPGTADQIRENTFIKGLVDNGIWDDCLQIFILNTYGDKSYSLINFKTPGTLNGTFTGNGLYTPGMGYSALENSGAYIDTNFNPTSHGSTKYTQNECGIVVYCPSSVGIVATDDFFGATGAANANGVDCQIRGTGNLLTYRLNHSTAIQYSNTTSKGLYHFKRTANNASAVFKNGSSIGTSSVASTGLVNRTFKIGAVDVNGSVTAQTIKYCGLWIVGASLNGKEAILDTLWDAYLASDVPTTITLPSFPTYTSYSNDKAGYVSAVGSMTSAQNTNPVVEVLPNVSVTTGALAYQGAISAPNGSIYLIPAAATNVGKFNPSTESFSTFGTIASGAQKYGSGTLIGTKIYCCPYNATSVMVIETSNDTVSYFDIAGTESASNTGDITGSAKWWGFYIGSDGYVYGIPYSATEAIKINPSTNAITFIDGTGTVSLGAGNLSGTFKWDAGLCYGDYIYGSASDATDCCKIDVVAGTVSRFGSLGAGTSKYSYMILGGNDKIYMCGYSNNNVKIIDPSNDSITTATGTLTSSSIYILGGFILPNGQPLITPGGHLGKIHTISSDAVTGFSDLFPPASGTISFSAKMAANGNIYVLTGSTTRIFKIYLPKYTCSPDDNFRLSRYLNNF